MSTNLLQQYTTGEMCMKLVYIATSLWSRVFLEKTTAAQNCQEILCHLWNLKVQYILYNSMPPLLILTQINPFHNHPHYFFKIQLNITALSKPRYFKWLPPFSLSGQHFVYISYMLYPAHSSWCCHSHSIQWRVWTMKLLIMKISPDFWYSVPVWSNYSPKHTFFQFWLLWFGHITCWSCP